MPVATVRKRSVVHGLPALLILIICSSAGIGANTAYVGRPAGPFTIEAVWEWAPPKTGETIRLAAAQSDDGALIELFWREDRTGWLPVDRLGVRSISASDGSTRIIDLGALTLKEHARYRIVLSLQPAAKVGAVGVYGLESGEVLAQRSFALPEAAGEWKPVISQAADEALPKRVRSVILPHYLPLGDRFTVGERFEGGILPVARFDKQQVVTVRVESPVPPPGEYRISYIGPGQDRTGAVPVATFAPIRTDNWHEIPLAQLPPEPITLLLEYVDHGEQIVTQTRDIAVGSARLQFELAAIDRTKGVVTGRLHADFTGPSRVRDTGLSVKAVFTPLVLPSEDGEVHSLPVEMPLFNGSLGDAQARSPLTLRVPAPRRTGAYKMEIQIDADPQVALELSGMTVYFSTDPARDMPIAATEQAATQILVFDPTAQDWNSPDAVLWSWKPGIERGYSALETSRSRGPAGVKLRHGGIWGDQVVLVTGGRLATIAEYPSGRRRWATYIESGANPHAIELLPNGDVAVAASTGGWVRLYTASQPLNPDHFVQVALPGAHGVLWDPRYNLLWAVGDNDLVGFRVRKTTSEPVLEAVVRSPLPTPHGHDLAPVFGDPDRLWVTTGSNVYQYVKTSGKWLNTYYGEITLRYPGVKGIGNQPSGQVVYSFPSGESLHSWTTDTVHFLFPKYERTRDGAAFYKIRLWNPDYQ